VARRPCAARAEAESRLTPRFDAPDDLRRDPAAAEHVAREASVFSARRQALDEQGALLQKQVEQVQAQVAASNRRSTPPRCRAACRTRS
jgi:hypothetical protein